MKLHWSPRSPFVRKVMIVLHETGQLDRVERVRTVVAVGAPPGPDILDDNPLGKIPALVLDDGRCLFDSRVICEYLDTRHVGQRLLPDDGEARLTHLRWQALGDGVTDILLLMRTEYLRAQPDATILEGFRRKLFASFGRLEAEAEQLVATPFGLGQISILCAIGQLDFRYAGSNWQAAYPALAGWYDAYSQRDSVKATAVVDDAPPTGKDTHSLLDFLQIR
jgi:glutathione S-transferase